MQVVCPGFSVDCLETLEEISEQNKEFFLHNGGEQYRYIPALNDSDISINMIRLILKDIL
ncbi:Ferrochelatase [Providencia rustigianii]|nr:Ferrochelatase [Providencia rustigianii]